MDGHGSVREVVQGRELPLRFALVDEEGDAERTVWARCVDAEGLFADRAAFRERLTLLGCAPTGRLLRAPDRPPARQRPPARRTPPGGGARRRRGPTGCGR